jgi:hypothetical protein
MILGASLIAGVAVENIAKMTTNSRIEVKLQELGFCCEEKNILKIKNLAPSTTTDKELEDLILEHI